MPRIEAVQSFFYHCNIRIAAVIHDISAKYHPVKLLAIQVFYDVCPKLLRMHPVRCDCQSLIPLFYRVKILCMDIPQIFPRLMVTNQMQVAHPCNCVFPVNALQRKCDFLSLK